MAVIGAKGYARMGPLTRQSACWHRKVRPLIGHWNQDLGEAGEKLRDVEMAGEDHQLTVQGLRLFAKGQAHTVGAGLEGLQGQAVLIAVQTAVELRKKRQGVQPGPAWPIILDGQDPRAQAAKKLGKL